MKSAYNHIYSIRMDRLILLTLVFASVCMAQPNKTYDLKYNFGQEKTLRYKIQQFDSTKYQDQTDFETNLTQKVQTLTIHPNHKKKAYTATLKLDSVSRDRIAYSDQDEQRALFINADPEFQEIVLTIDERGKALEKNIAFVPILIPLPNEPVLPNQTWQFEFKYPAHGTEFFKGETATTGHCLLYDIQQDTIAVIIAEIESKTEGKLKQIKLKNTIEYTYQKNQSSTNLLYFDMIKGCMTKIVATMKTGELIKKRPFYYQKTSVSKQYIHLMKDGPSP